MAEGCEPVIQFSGRWAPNSPHGWGAGPGFPGEREASAGLTELERAGWNQQRRGWGSGPLMPCNPRATSERGTEHPDHCAGPSRTAGPPDVSVFRRRTWDGWRSWLQQSHQAVKEKGKLGQRPSSSGAPRHPPLHPCSERIPLNSGLRGLRDQAHLGPGRKDPRLRPV